ncbi:MAG: endonuclease domain-containing protein [Bacteroidia bacterium]
MSRKIYPYNRPMKEFARKMRNYPTPAEKELWRHLKGKQMLGFDFHRQKAVDNFILDFFCHELCLGIEVDGKGHLWTEVAENDLKKKTKMKEFGITVLRFTNEEVLENTKMVLNKIEDWIKERGLAHTPMSPL